MRIKKTTGTVILIAIIAMHISIRIMAKDAYLISSADYQSASLINKEATTAIVPLTFQSGSLLISGLGASANAQQHPLPY